MSAISSTLEHLYSLRLLAAMGYGSRKTNLNRIADGTLPAVLVGNTYKVRESDLHLIAVPVTDPSEGAV